MDGLDSQDRPFYYVLDADRNPQPADTLTWSQWFSDTAGRRVASDAGDGWELFTYCMGLDTSGAGEALIFESQLIIDRGPEGPERDFWKYCTWDEAQAGHSTIVETMRNLRE